MINKTRSANNFLVFTPGPSLSSVSAILCNVWYFTENLILAMWSKVVRVTFSCQCWFLSTEVDYLGQLLNLLEKHKNTIQTNTWTSRGRKMYVQKLWSNRYSNYNCYQKTVTKLVREPQPLICFTPPPSPPYQLILVLYPPPLVSFSLQLFNDLSKHLVHSPLSSS